MKTSRWFGAVVGMVLGMWVMAFAQSWTAPKTWSQGELVTPDMMNTHVRDNLTVLRAGGLAISGQAANRIPYASSASQLATSASLVWDGTTLSSPALKVSSIGSAAAGTIGLSANKLAFLGGSTGFSFLTSAGGALASIDEHGIASMSGWYNSATLQPGFLAYNSSSDASGSPVDFDTEVYDITGAFASDTFTAPVTGYYLLCANVDILQTSAAAATLSINTTAANYQIAHATIGATSYHSLNGCIMAPMTATNTATVVTVGAESVRGSASRETTFSGRLMP
jgi:hypothetical protein